MKSFGVKEENIEIQTTARTPVLFKDRKQSRTSEDNSNKSSGTITSPQ